MRMAMDWQDELRRADHGEWSSRASGRGVTGFLATARDRLAGSVRSFRAVLRKPSHRRIVVSAIAVAIVVVAVGVLWPAVANVADQPATEPALTGDDVGGGPDPDTEPGSVFGGSGQDVPGGEPRHETEGTRRQGTGPTTPQPPPRSRSSTSTEGSVRAPDTQRATTTPIVIGFYPGWVSESPREVDYSPWTHVGHFGVYPRADGSLRFGDFAASELGPAVQASHQAGRKALLAIGSDSHGEEFRSAASGRHRADFVRNIVQTAIKYGYDGIDIGWASAVDSKKFAALITDLRSAIDAARSNLILTFDAVSGLLPPWLAAQVHSRVDYINLMSYWSDGADELARYTRAGVPAEKLIVGICLYQGDTNGDDSCYGSSSRRVDKVISVASAQGAAGVMVWSFDHLNGDWEDARLEFLRRFAAKTAG